MQTDSPVVSFDDEDLVVVDADDTVLGHRAKAACHDGPGVLHRAFSVFLFDATGHLLLQQRSAEKRLWPLYWSNTCCSHPRRGEAMAAAAQRRTQEELALRVPLHFAYKFVYRAPFGAAGTEHEMCSVFVGDLQAGWRINPREVAATRLVTVAALDAALLASPTHYTPWLHLEWQRLRGPLWPWLQATLPALAQS